MIPAASRHPARESATSQAIPSTNDAHGSTNTTGADDLSRSLLDQVTGGGDGRRSGGSADVPTDAQLEATNRTLNELQRQLGATRAEGARAAEAGDTTRAAEKLAAAKELIATLDQRLLSFQSDLRRARAARPDDPTVQWLTGELLLQVGGAPEEVLPFFERAVNGGLQRVEVLTGLAKVQLEANQFELAYQSGLKALNLNDDDPAVWEVFEGVALGLEHFDEIIRRIDTAFPQSRPVWAAAIRGRAQTLSDQWIAEQKLRSAEAAANDLPRVRLTIDHVRFDRGPDGNTLVNPKVTGRHEVEVELFEDQAPATVANFLTLVESGFYNGTRFHWAESASMAVGGDPNSKNRDPEDDGQGGPGYVIPDEFACLGARLHFRGTLAMVATGPQTAGSQFLIALVPHPTFAHRLTAFGRVIRGQEGVDRITPGRTNLRVGQSGKPIPGDLLVRAEVIRKRPHAYRLPVR